MVSKDKDGYKAVCYSKLTAVLVEAIKELKTQNDALKNQLEEKVADYQLQIKKQQAQIEELRALIKGLKP